MNETILVSSLPQNADRTTDLSTNGFILPVLILGKSPILLLSIRPGVMKRIELLWVSKEDRDQLGKARKVIRYQGPPQQDRAQPLKNSLTN